MSKAGEFIFAGKITIKDGIMWIRPDDDSGPPYRTQLESGVRHMIALGDAQYIGKEIEEDRGEEQKPCLSKKAQADFKKTKWRTIIK